MNLPSKPVRREPARNAGAPAVYRPQSAPVQRRPAAPPVYRPQPISVQPKVGLADKNVRPTAAPAVYRPLRTQVVQPMSWARLGAAGGFVGAAGLAFVSAPLTVPTLATVGAVTAATGVTAALGHAVGRGIEYFRPRRVEAEAPATPPPVVRRVEQAASSSSSSSSKSGAREGKQEAERDPFGEMRGPVRIQVRQGEGGASGEHHKDFQFSFAGTRSTVRYNLDPWIVGNKAIAQPAGYGGIANAAVTAWSCDDSIVDHLVNGVALARASADDTEGEADSAHLQDPARRAFVLHLMALRGNIVQRIQDVPNNCPASVVVETKVRREVESETVQINWKPILKAGRALVRAAILAGTRCPVKDAVTCAHDALAAAVATQPGLTALQEYGLLSADGRTFNMSAGSRRMRVGKSLNFATGHLRFILYLEWRAVDELTHAG